MPYRKKFTKRAPRKTYRRRTYKRKALPYKMYRKLKSLQYPENKFVIASQALTPVSSTGSSFRLNVVGPGSDDNSRIGDKITSKRLTGNIFCVGDGSTLTRVRVMIYWVNLPIGGALPPIADILQTPALLTSGRKVDFMSRFGMIINKVIPLDPSGRNSYNLRVNIPMRRVVQFTEVTPPEDSMYKNMLVITLLSDQPTNTPSVEFFLSYFYTDA